MTARVLTAVAALGVAAPTAAEAVVVKVESTRGNPIAAMVSAGGAPERAVRPDGTVEVPGARDGRLRLRVVRTVNASCDPRSSGTRQVVTVAKVQARDGRAAVRVRSLIPQRTDPALSPRELRTIGLINRERAAAGAPPVAISPVLNVAADAHSTWSASAPVERMTAAPHAGAGCRGPRARAADAGWFGAVGENVDYVFSPIGRRVEKTAAEALAFWKRSPGHSRNMLDPAHRWVGVSFVDGFVTTLYGTECPQGQWDGCRSLGTGDPNAPDRDARRRRGGGR